MSGYTWLSLKPEKVQTNQSTNETAHHHNDLACPYLAVNTITHKNKQKNKPHKSKQKYCACTVKQHPTKQYDLSRCFA